MPLACACTLLAPACDPNHPSWQGMYVSLMTACIFCRTVMMQTGTLHWFERS